MPLVNWPRLHSAMEAADVDVLVASTPPNVTYLSDFWSLSHWSRRAAQAFAVARRTRERAVEVVVPLSNADLLSTDPATAPTAVAAYGTFAFTGNSDAAARLLPEERLVAQLLDGDGGRIHDSALDALRAAIIDAARGRRARVALEAGGLEPQEVAHLRASLPGMAWEDGVALLRDVRAVKTAREVELLRAAAVRSAEAMHEALDATSVGDHEIDVQIRFHAGLVQRGVEPFLTSITSGRRTVLPNGQAGTRVLELGDLVRFDGGGRYHRYAADVARVGAVGEATAKQRDYYRAIRDGLEAAIGMVRAGVRVSDVFARAVESTRQAGLTQFERTHCGHGIGIENYDEPSINPANDAVLEDGMVICIETPYYEFGWGGIQVEDTLLVTPTGAERFTASPVELPICPTSPSDRRKDGHDA